jgi:hypothetical protein
MPSEEGKRLRADAEKACVHRDASVKEYLHRVDQLPSLPRPDGTVAVRIAADDLKKNSPTSRTDIPRKGQTAGQCSAGTRAFCGYLRPLNSGLKTTPRHASLDRQWNQLHQIRIRRTRLRLWYRQRAAFL